MSIKIVCQICGNENIRRLGGTRCYCSKCNRAQWMAVIGDQKIKTIPSDRTKK